MCVTSCLRVVARRSTPCPRKRTAFPNRVCRPSGACVRSHAPAQRLRLSSRSNRFCPAATSCLESPNDTSAEVFLTTHGISADAVSKAAFFYPEVLALDVERRVEPAFSYLQQLGLTAADLQSMLVDHPQVFSYDVEDRLKAVVEFLMAKAGLDLPGVLHVIRRYPHVFSLDVRGYLQPQLAFLFSLGLPNEELSELILTRPLVLGPGIDSVVKFLLQMGCPRKKVNKLLRTYPLDYSVPIIYNEENDDAKT